MNIDNYGVKTVEKDEWLSNQVTWTVEHGHRSELKPTAP